MTFDFSNPRPVTDVADSNDYHRLPVSEKQLRFAHQIAARKKIAVPDAALVDRARLSRWIDKNKDQAPSRFANYPSSKQVAFAERIARIKRRSVPNECFKDRKLMSRWIDSNQ
ncbi:hypothetical protein E4Z66_15805 [Aliishimia ponticola]|uniref:Uncharacterized protein n=2 Tax=Aliishimia ponticola TaxID=2499833 RepID=A0A4S4N8C0_9RHOB|nr:hypothetical protein E4Z66_15805 [Aliishimia ponticola]